MVAIFRGHCIHCVEKDICFEKGQCVLEDFLKDFEDDLSDDFSELNEDVSELNEKEEYLIISNDGPKSIFGEDTGGSAAPGDNNSLQQ